MTTRATRKASAPSVSTGDSTKSDIRKLFDEVENACEIESSKASYQVGPLETHADASDRLGARLDQANALMSVLVEVGETFSEMNPKVCSAYHACVQDLLSAARVDARIVRSKSQLHK